MMVQLSVSDGGGSSPRSSSRNVDFSSLSPIDINVFKGDGVNPGLQGYGQTTAHMTADSFYDIHSIYRQDRSGTEKFRAFNRYGRIYTEDEMGSYIPYVFMVRPSLNMLKTESRAGDPEKDLVDGAVNEPIMAHLYAENPYLLEMLSDDFSQFHDFIPYLVGRTESFPVQDYAIKAYDVGQLYTPFKFFIGGKSDESLAGLNFSMEFADDKDLTITKLFYIWEHYINCIMNGTIIADSFVRSNKIANYFTSIYYFLCGPDGSEIVYYCKVTGAMPTEVPFSDLSFNRGSNIERKRSITFNASYIEHMNPVILSEFNYNAHMIHNIQSVGGKYVNLDKQNQNSFYGSMLGKPMSRSAILSKTEPHYDINIGTGQTIVDTPFIVSKGGKKYYLLWTKRKAINQGAINLVNEAANQS